MAANILSFLKKLDTPDLTLPPGIQLINPYYEDKQVLKIADSFYHKFYDDDKSRLLILGINPGRFGGGVTGIPFTDPKRLISECQIEYHGKITHEPSSVFVYEMIKAFGGVEKFYQKIYINSLCPLAITKNTEAGKVVNYNYYDSPALFESLYNFIVDNITKQIDLGVRTDVCFCFGTGKNEAALRKINNKHQFFKKIVALEHPRFIVQYKNKHQDYYINKYISAFNEAG